jgi:lactate dehydrogenase-like 2-hydroxyacid dehydrogenase
MRILIPDAQFLDDAEIERAAAGAGVTFEVHRATRETEVPEESWRACDAVICYHVIQYRGAWLDWLERCKVIVRAGVGFDNIDIDMAAARGIPVCNVPDYGTTDVADHAIAMMMTLTRGIASYDEHLRADPVGGWRFEKPPLVRRMRGLTFGVVGLGRIGTAAALRARAFGMDVLFYDPALPTGTELSFGFQRAHSLADLMSRSDIVSLHCPLTGTTRGMINAEALAAAKAGQILVNTARGAVVDLDALHAALRDGTLGGAALDVLPVEPAEPDHPLIRAWAAREPWIAGRLLLSPHAAFYSPSSIVDLRRKSAETAMAALGGAPINRVNDVRVKA